MELEKSLYWYWDNILISDEEAASLLDFDNKFENSYEFLCFEICFLDNPTILESFHLLPLDNYQ